MALNSLWNRLTEVSTQPDRRSLRLWVWIREKLDLALYKPQPASNVQISSLIGRRGQYYILKNPEAVTYYQISERDYFIWEKMDGTLSVKDLVIEYFLKYGSFAFARIARFVYGLKLNSMLADQPVNIYQQVNLRLHERRLGYRLQQFGSAFMQKPFAIHGIDGLIDWLYRWGGWLLFTRPLQVMYIIISAVGIVLFVRAFQAPTYNLFAVNGSYWLGLIALAVILLFTLLTHEFAHALTVKNYGREVRRAGLMIYLGMPGFFVDTSDIWMEGKRARLAVTWAGPFSGLVLSGIAAIILTIWPEFSLNPVLFRFAFLSYVIVFMNVNPLIKLDGYYLLMDWLEIPNLRSKSFAFLRNGLPGKFKAKDAGGMSQKRLKWVPNFGSFSREELIFTIFGLLSALWTAYAVYMGINIWQTRMVVALQSLIDWGGDLTQLPITLLVLLLSVVFVSMISLFIWGLLRRVYLQAANRGIFSDTWYVAGLLLALTLALLFVDSISTLPFLGTLIGLVALLLALIFAWKNAQNYAGSRYSAFFWLSGLAALVWMIVVIYTSLNEFTLLPIGYEGATLSVFSIIPLIALLIACVSLWIGRDIKAISLVEWGVILFGILVSAGYVLWAIMVENISGDPLAIWVIANAVLPWLALVALVPTIYSHWRTNTAPAWLVYALALVWLVITAFINLPSLVLYLLLLSSLYLHLLAYRMLPLSSDRPDTRLDISDDSRLQRAFTWSMASIFTQFQEVAGYRAAASLEARFSTYASSAGWDIVLLQDNIQEHSSGEMGLIERGEMYATALTLLLDLVSRYIGEKLTIRILQNAYDGLPWEEREVGGQYFLKHVERAGVLSEEFQSIRQDYAVLLRRMPLFATMDDQEIDLLIARLKPVRYAPGKVIIRQGDKGDRFYIIQQGQVEVSQTEENGVTEVVNQLYRGAYFGELALLRDAPRNATCRAAIPTDTLTLRKQDFDDLVKQRFIMREKLDDSIARAELLRRIPLFSEMDGMQIKHISARLRKRSYKMGERIITQGEIGESFFVIKEGRVKVFMTQDGEEHAIVERGPGEYVGEVALLLDVPRTASVIALTDVHVYVLHKDDFKPLVAEHMNISRGLERESSRRMIDLRRVASSVD